MSTSSTVERGAFEPSSHQSRVVVGGKVKDDDGNNWSWFGGELLHEGEDSITVHMRRDDKPAQIKRSMIITLKYEPPLPRHAVV
jgi:hypothetical protein